MTECPALVQVFEDNVELGKRLCSFVKDRYDEAVASRGKFHVAVSGGSLPKFLKGLSKRQDIDWTKWWVYFCDERYVPNDDPDSNYGALKQVLLDDTYNSTPKSSYFRNYMDQTRELEGASKFQYCLTVLSYHDLSIVLSLSLKISIPDCQILKINSSVPVEEAAEEYEKKMREQLPTMDLDLALCGMGPDGHTCSLFPGHALLSEDSVDIAPISDSPKPPPKRITMTYRLLRKCHQVVFVVTGESKVPMVVSSLHDDLDKTTPAGRVRPDSGKLFWFLDSKAAAGLPDRAATPAAN